MYLSLTVGYFSSSARRRTTALLGAAKAAMKSRNEDRADRNRSVDRLRLIGARPPASCA